MDQGLGQVELVRGSRLLRGTALGQTKTVRGPRLLKEGLMLACWALTVLCDPFDLTVGSQNLLHPGP